MNLFNAVIFPFKHFSCGVLGRWINSPNVFWHSTNAQKYDRKLNWTYSCHSNTLSHCCYTQSVRADQLYLCFLFDFTVGRRLDDQTRRKTKSEICASHFAMALASGTWIHSYLLFFFHVRTLPYFHFVVVVGGYSGNPANTHMQSGEREHFVLLLICGVGGIVMVHGRHRRLCCCEVQEKRNETKCFMCRLLCAHTNVQKRS